MVRIVDDVSTEMPDLEHAIRLTGYGIFHYEILAVCALSVLCLGFQNGLSSYVFPAAQCELDLTSFEIGILNVAFLVGGVTSCFLWGGLADNVGRKRVLVVSHLANAVVTIFCAVLPGTLTLIAGRCLNGFFAGAPGSIIFSYAAEFQPTKYQSVVVCCCGIVFTISWLLLPFLAYVILPLPIQLTTTTVFVLLPWRLFLLTLGFPELMTGLWFLRMPESPRFYMAKKMPKECLEVLRLMYSRNKDKRPEDYPVNRLHTHSVEDETKMAQQIASLVKAPLLKLSCLSCAIMFANMFGTFGLGLWLPEFFVRFRQFELHHPDRPASILELSSHVDKNVTCQPTFDASVTVSTVVIAVSAIIYNAVAGAIATKVSAKVIPLVSMVVGGVSSATIYFLTSSVQNLVVASVFQASMLTANMTIGNMVIEQFPTKVTGMAMCAIMFFGRTGAIVSNFLFGYFIDDRCEIPICVVAVLVLSGALLCWAVPTKKASGNKVTHEMDTRTGTQCVPS
ncbi:synaptic vesicle glycoprotein 2A-like [Cylas formicarius]|uniref:synaptic vesicle glycoprotein 2A-like n=1 Tax=Cylas formicarius TaxID=197179 RepID=UPI002958DDAF|nr:synaptic vesicle glycoprotein 2A-like [Cylas formicarius]